MVRRLQSLPVWLVCLFVFLSVFSFRLLLAFGLKRDLTSDRCEVEMIAESLARDGMFGNPYKLPTGPTSHAAPAYPYLLSAIYKAEGTGPAAEAVRQFLCCGVTSLEYAFLPLLAAIAGLGAWTGAAAGLAGGILAVHFWIETKCSFGEPYHALLLVLLCAFSLKLWKRGASTMAQELLLGFGWGAALLFAPNLLTVLCGFCCLDPLAFSRENRVRRVRNLAVRTAAIVAVLTPWTIRNYREFHKWMFIRGNFGLELAVSNNDLSAPALADNIKTPITGKIHPMISMEAVRALKTAGETAYFSRQFEAGKEWILSHPGEFASRTAVRCLYFWFPPPEERNHALLYAVVVWAITLLGFEGLFRIRGKRPAFLMTCVLWLAYPVVYYVIQADPRYRYPIDWSILLCACHAVRGHALRLYAAASSRIGRREEGMVPSGE
jgi:hypothetical protein